MEQKSFVEGKLAKAQPALEAAQSAVQGVSPANIVELKNMQNPPAAVKLAMEPVIALLENKDKIVEWADIKAIVRQDNFKNRVLDFQKEDIKPKCKNFIVKNYLQDETTYDIDKFYKASKAAGPLAKWLKSIIEFAEIYEQIAPMREQVA